MQIQLIKKKKETKETKKLFINKILHTRVVYKNIQTLLFSL